MLPFHEDLSLDLQHPCGTWVWPFVPIIPVLRIAWGTERLERFLGLAGQPERERDRVGQRGDRDRHRERGKEGG